MAGSIGKLQASLAAANQETTLALANLNFDFSLVRLEAPLEYKELGASLTAKRRDAAESGTPHLIARRLGSLFGSILPSTPALTSAYGQRASQISKSSLVNPLASERYGPFQDYVGVDGTSIWAAATSGSAAIAVHLLACMLARVWSPSEAVSIWQELVAERKLEISSPGASSSNSLGNIVAANLSITVDQLSEWDASARAWLQAADSVRLTQIKQKQLMLILENVNIPVNTTPDPYSSVMKAWTMALTTMDCIIGGSAYSIRDGAVLVALSAWHIYPNLVVLGSQTQEVRQNDSLVNVSGVITIGLEGIDTGGAKGVSWSLPLAFLRYYGGPIIAERSMNTSSGRFSVAEFAQVAHGCTLGLWGITSHQLEEGLDLVKLVWECIDAGRHDLGLNNKELALLDQSWIKLLSGSADTFLQFHGDERRTNKRLIALGMRRPSLLAPDVSPILNLCRPLDIIALLKPESFDTAIEFLRKLVRKADIEPDSLIVLYANPFTNCKLSRQEFVVTTLFPSNDSKNDGRSSLSWVPTVTGKYELHSKTGQTIELTGAQVHETPLDSSPQQDSFGETQENANICWNNPPDFFKRVSTIESRAPVPAAQKNKSDFKHISSWFGGSPRKHEPDLEYSSSVYFSFLAGDASHFALLHRPGSAGSKNSIFIGLSHITKLFRGGDISPKLLYGFFDRAYKEKRVFARSLVAFASIMPIYTDMSNATISPHLITSPKHLGDYKWTAGSGTQRSLGPLKMTRAGMFACIGTMESGFIDFACEDLEQVMALSHGDSLYIAAPLLTDPSIRRESHEVQRVVGNIGRAGIALLIPPHNPRVREHDPDCWRLINHDSFDGKLENNFRDTSLHLGFSGYERPLVTSEHGGRYIEAFFIEAIVSAHESGRWVADLDILNALKTLKADSVGKAGNARVPAYNSQHADVKTLIPLTAIDSWHELLEPP
ncbi:MAG: hypothetical protein MMC23_001393 [Stictis urceolatum]|nr:hypothetical protein [Stictis urceolata]